MMARSEACWALHHPLESVPTDTRTATSETSRLFRIIRVGLGAQIGMGTIEYLTF